MLCALRDLALLSFFLILTISFLLGHFATRVLWLALQLMHLTVFDVQTV